jgi:sulfatase maturation enzyme AslB (radical SAM superfamily)
MIIPLFWKTLDQALASKTAKDKIFNVHTNGMVYKEDLVKKFSKFKSAHIGFSIDAIGPMNDYIRYGSKWENIIDNLRKYMNDCEEYDNVSISVRTTYTPWNIYYYDELYDYFQKEFGIDAIGCWCDDKPWNDVRYLPRKTKDGIIQKLSKYESTNDSWLHKFDELKKWISTTPENHDELQNSFMEFNKKIDKIRKEKFEDVFPEYSKLFT